MDVFVRRYWVATLACVHGGVSGVRSSLDPWSRAEIAVDGRRLEKSCSPGRQLAGRLFWVSGLFSPPLPGG